LALSSQQSAKEKPNPLHRGGAETRRRQTNCLPLIKKHSALSSQQSAKEKPNPLHHGGAETRRRQTNCLPLIEKHSAVSNQPKKNETRFTAEREEDKPTAYR